MNCTSHNMIYEGIVNIFNGDILIEVVEMWKCKKCGATRVSIRGPGITGTNEGVLGAIDPSDGRRWMLIISKGMGSLPPQLYVIPAMPGETVMLNIPNETERELVINAEYNLITKQSMSKPRYVVSYLLEDVIRGSIDLSSWPPSVLSLKNQSR
ncbi:MAG: hypothetical protein QXP38_01470 [Nitrososphaerota archaeon]